MRSSQQSFKPALGLLLTVASLLLCVIALNHSWAHLVIAMAFNQTSASTMEQTKARTNEAYGQLPLSFEANQGQADSQAKFLSRGSGYSLFLMPTEAVLSLIKPNAHSTEESQAATSEQALLRMKLIGANSSSQISGLDKLPGKSNYLIGNNPAKWHTNIPNYARVKYQEVYPGVNLIYYGNQQQLEYDFIVSPGASPQSITLDFDGADRLEVDAQGDLVIQMVGEAIHQRRPSIYQELNGARHEISGGYVLKDKYQVGFQVGNYDTTQPLVIDPVLLYSTYFGALTEGRAIAVDANGNAYVTGTAGVIPTVNPFQPTYSGGNSDIFVAKLSPAGNGLVYSTYLGGENNDTGFSLALHTDTAGLTYAYVTGVTKSSYFPIKAGAFQSAFMGGTSDYYGGDVFLAVLNPAGDSLKYCSYLGGIGDERGWGIATDSSGNAYIAGDTNSNFTNLPQFPTRNGFRNPSQDSCGSYSCWEAFVVKINPNLSGDASLVYSTLLGSTGTHDNASGIAVRGNIAYVTGNTSSTDFPTTPNAFQTAYAGGSRDAFVAEIDTSKSGAISLVYSTLLGGHGDDVGNKIAADSLGNVYVVGFTASVDNASTPQNEGFPTTIGAYQTTYGGGLRDAFMAKLNLASQSSNDLIYSTYFGGSGQDEGSDVGLDAAGSAYIIGLTLSPNFPIINPWRFNDLVGCGILGNTFGGGTCGADPCADIFVAKIYLRGHGLADLVYSTYLGGKKEDIGFGIAVDAASGNAYVTGYTDSTSGSNNFPTANTLPNNGNYSPNTRSAFVAKIVPTYTSSCLNSTISWTGAAGDGLWQTAGNWNTLTVPGLNDNVCISDANAIVTLSAGSYSINSLNCAGTLIISAGSLSITATTILSQVNNLTLNGGILSGTGHLVVYGLCNWTSGQMTGTGSTNIAATGALNMGGGDKLMVDHTLNNAGNAEWTSGRLFGDRMTFNNLTCGTIHIENDTSFGRFCGGCVETFNNSGTLRSHGTTSFHNFFYNTGTVDVQAGVFSLPSTNGVGKSTGNFDISPGAVLDLGVYQLGNGTTITGNGITRIGAVTVTDSASLQNSDTNQAELYGSLTVTSNGNLNITSCRAFTPSTITVNGLMIAQKLEIPFLYSAPPQPLITGAGELKITGTFNWGTGNMDGTGSTTIDAMATMNISGADKTVFHRTINNDGVTKWSGGNFYGDQTSFNNRAGSTFNIQTDSVFGRYCGGCTITFNNVGKLLKCGGAGTATFSLSDFINPGTVGVAAGTLNINGLTNWPTADCSTGNRAPTANAGGPYSVVEGSSITVTATGSDLDGDPLTFAWDLDNNGTFETSGQSAVFSTANLDGPSTRTVTVKVTDSHGLSGLAQAAINVTNSAPNVIPSPNQQFSTEGYSLPVNLGMFTDVAADGPWAVDINWGDGSSHTSFSTNTAGSLDNKLHTYLDNGTYTVTIKITDKDGAVGSNTFNIQVANIPPTGSSIIAPVTPIPVNTSINASATITDQGVLDTHTATWTWGDNNSSAGNVSEANGSGSVSGSHTYTAAGVYTLTLTVTDKDGGSSLATFLYVVVYDPSAGFITGNGKIDSPTGAYTLNPSLTGKASFGFEARYQKGATVPDGQTRFRFQVASLDFQSTSYQWLVVSGPKAQFKGSGTINGSGNYDFILTATDGQINGGGGVDKFRIKIWDHATGQIIYDNQMGADDDASPTTAITSGSIIIHSN